jgi:hypothetical protein
MTIAEVCPDGLVLQKLKKALKKTWRQKKACAINVAPMAGWISANSDEGRGLEPPWLGDT